MACWQIPAHRAFAFATVCMDETAQRALCIGENAESAKKGSKDGEVILPTIAAGSEQRRRPRSGKRIRTTQVGPGPTPSDTKAPAHDDDDDDQRNSFIQHTRVMECWFSFARTDTSHSEAHWLTEKRADAFLIKLTWGKRWRIEFANSASLNSLLFRSMLMLHLERCLMHYALSTLSAL